MLFLAGVWVLAGLLLTMGWMDTLTYHLPGIRLLIEGWNPVMAATPEALAENMAFDPWEMRQWHVLSMPKSVWVFDAVAYFFTGTATNLLFPLFPFLFCTATMQLWRFMRGCSWLPRGLAVAVLWIIVPSPCFSMVDTAIALGAMGLFSAMGRVLKGERPDWLGLVCHSFWMMTAKQTGLWFCFLFWVLFSLMVLWLHREALFRVAIRLVSVAATLVALLCLVCAAPYFTAWRNYGHPFYPKYSVDPVAFPVHDITSDFLIANDDARSMWHLGSFVNAYISRTLAMAYYRWKLNQSEFAPRRSTRAQGGGDGFGRGGPTDTQSRLFLLTAFIVVFIFGKRPERWLGGMLLVGILAVPTPMVGYLRYVNWVWFVWILAMSALLGARDKWMRRVALGLVTLGVLKSGATAVFSISILVDSVYAAQRFLRESPPKVIYGYYSDGLKAETLEEMFRIVPLEVVGSPIRTSLCNLRLLCRQLPALSGAEIRALPLALEVRERHPTFFGGEFKLDPGSGMETGSLFASNAALPNRMQRIRNYPRLVAETWFVRAPRLLLNRLGL